MATGLYETLEIQSDASPEQIRKAYKKKALQTHPDRLPPNVSSTEKASAEERFQLVNNAYEVLIDPEKRRTYDTHGVWPPQNPPPDQPRRSYNRNNDHFYPDTFSSDPFFRSPFQRSGRHFAFTDPFVLFNSLFGDYHEQHPLHPNDRGRHSHQDRFNTDPFSSMGFPSSFSSMLTGGFGGFHGGGGNSGVMSSSFQSSFANTGQNPRWVSESRMTRSINGVTQSVHERRDSDGNTHVTVKYPDGRRTYTINGVEQPSAEAIEAPPSNNHHSHGHNHRSGSNYRNPSGSYHANPNAPGQHRGW